MPLLTAHANCHGSQRIDGDAGAMVERMRIERADASSVRLPPRRIQNVMILFAYSECEVRSARLNSMVQYSCNCLRRFALGIFGIKTSNSSTERNWSNYNFIHSKNRNRLLPTKVGKLLSVYANGRVVDRMKECEENGEEYVRARADALNLTRNSEELNWDQYREFDNGVSSSDEESI